MNRATLLRLVIGGALIAGAHGALIGVLPVYLEDHGQRPGAIGVVVGAYAASMAIARLVGGRLVSQVDPPRLLLVAGGLMLFAFLGYLVVDPGLPMLPARLAHGAAWGLYAVTSFSWIARTTTPATRGRAMGIYGMGTGVALVLTPAAGIALYEAADGPTVLGLGVAMSVGVMVLATRLAGEALAEPQLVVDDPGLAIGRVLVVLLLAMATTGLLEAFMPALAEEREVGSLTVVYVCFGLALGVGRVGGGVASDRLGRVAVTFASLGAVVGTFGAMNVASGTAAMSGLGVLYGLGVGAAAMALTADVADRTAGARQGRAMGMAAFLGDVGVGGGAVVGGLLASRSIGSLNAGGAALGLAGLAVLGAEALQRRRAPGPPSSPLASVSPSAAGSAPASTPGAVAPPAAPASPSVTQTGTAQEP